MGKIQFTDSESDFLYSIPKPGATLEDIGKSYSFLNRDAIPEEEVLSICLDKAISAGIVEIHERNKYRITNKWYALIHQFDDDAKNEIEAMIQFEEFLTSRTWP